MPYSQLHPHSKYSGSPVPNSPRICLTSIGKPAKGIFLSLTRQIIFFIPLLLILPHFMGIEGCIYCGPIADFLAAVVTIIMAFLEFKNMPKTNGE